jgi:hypothetical protein
MTFAPTINYPSGASVYASASFCNWARNASLPLQTPRTKRAARSTPAAPNRRYVGYRTWLQRDYRARLLEIPLANAGPGKWRR